MLSCLVGGWGLEMVVAGDMFATEAKEREWSGEGKDGLQTLEAERKRRAFKQ